MLTGICAVMFKKLKADIIKRLVQYGGNEDPLNINQTERRYMSNH